MDSSSTAITQSWKCDCTGNVQSACKSQYLKSMNISFSPIFADNGKYDPSTASGYMSVSNGAITYSPNTEYSFTLAMSPLAPNYMKMQDMTFLKNSKPSQYQSFSASYGINPSTPLTYDLTGALPSFLTFHQDSGVFNPNGTNCGDAATTDMSIAVSNKVGNASSAFQVIVQ